MNARTRRLILTVLCAALGVLAFSVAPAFAGLSFPFDGEFSPSSGSFGSLEANSVAVDDGSDQTYVADSQTGLVTIFNSAHTEVGVLDGGATPAGSFGFVSGEGAIAVNNDTGDVYVLDSAHAVVDVFDAAGNYKCQITGSVTPSATECDGVVGSATPSGGFSSPRGLAVNQDTGEVYVLDAERGVIDRFTVAGEFASQVEFSKAPIELSGSETRGLAVNSTNGDIYVGTGQTSSVAIFDSSGAFVEAWTGSNTPAESFAPAGSASEISVAVDDASGRVYVTDTSQVVTDVFESSGAYDTQFSHEYQIAGGTAVDQSTGQVLVSNGRTAPAASVVEIFGPALTVPDAHTGEGTEVGSTVAALSGTVDPDGLQLTDCHFDYGTDTSYGHTAPCAPGAASIAADSSEHAVTARLTGLEPGVTYHFRLSAENKNDEGEPSVGSDATLATPPAPAIDGATDANLTATSADLNVSINPEGFESTYQLQWGLTTSYGNVAPASPKSIGSGTADVLESQHIEGLEANKTYHWRVIAMNVNGTTTGSDHTFIYDTATGGGLPDNRAYEMVTPPQKNAAAIGLGVLIIAPDISEDGSRMVASSIQCFGEAQSCTADRESEGEPFLFTRTSHGWVTSALAPPAILGANTNLMDDANAGTALLSIQTPPMGEDDWFAAEPEGKFTDIGPVTPPSKGELGESGGAPIAATPDLSHLVWAWNSNVWSFPEGVDAENLYEYVGHGNDAPAVVGVSGGPESAALISMCGTRLGGPGEGAGALSTNGEVVYFTALGHDLGEVACPADLTAPPTSHLYARIDQSGTVDVSQRSPLNCSVAGGCANSPPGDANFSDASANGSKVFFTDTQQLTDQATEDSNSNDNAAPGKDCAGTVASGCNLYEYDLSSPKGENLLAVSAGDSSGDGPRVQRVIAVSADGSHVYFVAKGVLSGVDNDLGQTAQNGAKNMYVFERDTTYPNGHVAFITTLPSSDVMNEVAGSGNAYETSVTPDGRFMVFTSRGQLTEGDSGVSQVQVFRYDAQTADLVRVSVGNDGFNDDGNRPAEACFSPELGCPGDARIARGTSTGRRDQTMSHDGSYVFFESPVGLTPQALNEVQIATENGDPTYAQNIYEWHAGHVYLISDGKDATSVGRGGESTVKLLGTDAPGANVFFRTADSLVPEDTDTQLDYYDARICTASDPCVASGSPALPPCLGEACHGTPAGTPLSPNVPSATFNGEGNITPTPTTKVKSKAKPVKCKKGFVRTKARCVKNRKKKKTKAKKSVKTNRRAK
jgi:DNA-binding beta-propeller fold protein YncE